MIKIYSKHIVFRELIISLYNIIKDLGYKVKITDKIDICDNTLYILIGVAEFIEKKPKKYIIFQLEQTNVIHKKKKDIWFTEKYINLLKDASYILDYSRDNIKYLNNYYNIPNILYFPLNYSKYLDNVKKINENKKDIDILFLGTINDRRKYILEKLKKKYIVVIGSNNLWKEERDSIISRSKIIINIQYYENGLLEMVRLSYLLSVGAFIISEKGRELNLADEMKHFLILDNYNNLEKQVDKYIYNENDRIEKKNLFITSWKKTKFCDFTLNECLKNEDKGTVKLKGKINYYYPKNIESIQYNISDEGYCILKLPYIEDNELPNVSIITPTKNRKKFFKLAITNFNNFIYPSNKLEWVIVDNGSENLEDILPVDKRIKYIRIDNNKSIGFMRNKCIESCSYEMICYMDDDDVYRPESILARIKSLIKYKLEGIECVGCTQVGCYNLINGQSVLGSNSLLYLSEASMAHTKNFWMERNYDNLDYYGEFKYFLSYRQHKIKSIPYQFIMIALNHNSNTTGNLRNFKNYNNWVKDNCDNNIYDFYDMFDENIKMIINKLE